MSTNPIPTAGGNMQFNVDGVTDEENDLSHVDSASTATISAAVGPSEPLDTDVEGEIDLPCEEDNSVARRFRSTHRATGAAARAIAARLNKLDDAEEDDDVDENDFEEDEDGVTERFAVRSPKSPKSKGRRKNLDNNNYGFPSLNTPEFITWVRNKALLPLRENVSRFNPTMVHLLTNMVEAMVQTSYGPDSLFVDLDSSPLSSPIFSWPEDSLRVSEYDETTQRRRSPNNVSLLEFAFAGDIVPDSELSATFNIQSMEFPTSRHMYFAAAAFSSLTRYQRCRTTAEVPVKGSANEADTVKTVIKGYPSIIMATVNGMDWGKTALSTDLGRNRLRNPPDLSGLSSYSANVDVGHLSIRIHTFSDTLPPALMISDFVGKDESEIIHRLEGWADTTLANDSKRAIKKTFPRRSVERMYDEDLEDGAPRRIIIVSGVLIEGLHWNKHRRSEIEPYLAKSDCTAGQIREFRAGQKRTNAFEKEVMARLESHKSGVYFPFDNRDPDSIVEFLQIGDLSVCYNPVEAFSYVNYEARASAPTPEQVRRIAFAAVTKEAREKYEKAILQLQHQRAELVYAESEVEQALSEWNSVRGKSLAFIDGLLEKIRAMSIFTGVEISPDFTIYAQTGPIFAEGEHTKEGLNYTAKRYVGTYQIAINPLTLMIRVRNVRAPICVSYSKNWAFREDSTWPNDQKLEDRPFSSSHSRKRRAKSNSTLIDKTITKIALFHPHSSVSSYRTTVCLGGYSSQLSSSSKLGLYDRVDIVMSKLLSSLTFLQTMKISDPYVTGTFGALPINEPGADEETGVTDWQTFTSTNSNIKNLRAPYDPFGIPFDEEYTAQEIKASHYFWPKFKYFDEYLDEIDKMDMELEQNAKTEEELEQLELRMNALRTDAPQELMLGDPDYLYFGSLKLNPEAKSTEEPSPEKRVDEKYDEDEDDDGDL